MAQEYEVVTETSMRFQGRKYSRKENGYYYNSSTRRHLHQAIWIAHNGPIPKGYEIHHIDFDKENNDISNLACITSEEHHKIHSESLTEERKEAMRKNLRENAVPKATEWHRSEEGRRWHSEHAKMQVKMGVFKKERICAYCGKHYIGQIHSNNGNSFCSNNCKSAFRRASGVDDLEFTCPICHKTFKRNKYEYRRNKKKFGENYVPCCSNSCSSILSRGRNLKSTESLF